jgi:hypothetical protein
MSRQIKRFVDKITQAHGTSKQKSVNLQWESQNKKWNFGVKWTFKHQEIDRPLTKYDNALKELIIDGIDRSKLASMIYGVSINKGDGIGFATESPFKKV